MAKRDVRHATFANLRPVPTDIDAMLGGSDDVEWSSAAAILRDKTQPSGTADPPGGINPGDRRAVFALVRRLRPNRVLEVGTHLGYSTGAIALALQRNRDDGYQASGIVSVDLRDVNDDPAAPWRRAAAPLAPRDAVAAIAPDIATRFVCSPSLDYLSATDERFDLVFLDGDHAAPMVFDELHQLDDRLAPGAVVLLHDYFPDGRALWPGSLPCTGPWRAIRRLQRDGAPIRVRPLGKLPWPTKLGSHRTSLALLGRADP